MFTRKDTVTKEMSVINESAHVAVGLQLLEMSSTDLFTPAFFAYFLCFLGSKLRTTDHYYRTTHTRKSRFLAKFSFILMFNVCNDP